MKAAQFFGQRDVRVVDIPAPKPSENEALISIEWCGICGSDLSEFVHGPITIPSKERTHPITGDSFPVTMGHEFSGRIISAPADPRLKPGQAVMVDPRIYCTNCSRCTTGSTQCCTSLGFKGLSGAGGGFSETIAVDAKMCYPLPDDIDLSLATLIEPLAVAWHAVADSAITGWPERSVLIVGGGPVGVAHIFVLRALGCRNILVSEPTKTRAAQIKKIADAVFDPITESVGESCRALTGGEGVDIVFDCAGIQAGFDVGMDALRFKGTYMNVAVWLGSPMTVPFISFMLKEITLKCSLAYNDDEFKDTVDAFIAGKFGGIESMVTSRIHIDDITEKGFNELMTNKDQHIKILVTPDRSKVETK